MSQEPSMLTRTGLLVLNFLSSRFSRIQQALDPRRNIAVECGWPEGEITPESYQLKYERNPIAGRVVEVYPKQCWQVQPEVYEDEDPKKLTPFEQDWAALPSMLSPIPNKFNGPKGGPIWEVLKRADELSGIGRYGIILLGLDDINEDNNISLETPAQPRAGQKLTYLRVFPEQYARINSWDTDPFSPRYGYPLSYYVTFNNPTVQQIVGTQESVSTSKEVHYTRVVHIADNIQSNEVIGIPRQRPVFNNIQDCEKLYGGSAEMYWKGAFPGIGFEGLPEAMKGGHIDLKEMRESIEDFMNGLQRYYAIVGAQAKVLAPAVVDPTPQIRVQLEAICIKLNIPKRVFMGSERGELSSGQDDASWNDILRERHINYLSPRAISSFINHLMWLKVLREPTTYNIQWPDLTSQTPQEKAHVAFERSQALAQYANSRAREIIGPMDFLTKVLGFTEQEAIAIGKAADLAPIAPIASPVSTGNPGTNGNGGKAISGRTTGASANA